MPLDKRYQIGAHEIHHGIRLALRLTLAIALSFILLTAKRKALCRAVNRGTRVSLQLRKPISMMFRRMIRKMTHVDGPALKSSAICGRVARLPRLLILVSRPVLGPVLA
ncbi:hypothetical protein TNCV_1865731 [Trichonephila clavipes]|nr:hypothetical protein TNCV_1865731 [Trichonephila clavipes]